jgi:alpha-ketoglutarate-dependent taurine dioxygenase
MPLAFRPLARNIGAEVIGANLSGFLSDVDFEAIHEAWLENTVLLFRDQADLTPAQQVAFTRRFGELELHTLPQYTLPGQPEVFVVSNVVEGGRLIGASRSGRHWHSDSQFLTVPSAGSLLVAREVPPEEGDTLFANLVAAYEALPESTRQRIDGMKILCSRIRAWPISYPHRPPLTAAQKRDLPDVVHPLVRTHPETGRKSLYIGGNVVSEIVGMDVDEGRVLLDELREHATQPEFGYRHQWRVGDAVLWDNRCTLHCATPFDEERHRRVMHRTTVVGTRPA